MKKRANHNLPVLWLIALDGGILISWLSFMCMDIITKYFGPKASNKIAVLASAINVLTCAIFYIASIIPSNANDYTALDEILGGTWFILLGSTIAFLVLAVINNFLNWTIGKAFHKNPDGKLAYAVQSYISTFIGQFMDNFIFSLIVFVGFAPIFWDGFCWTVLQCSACALGRNHEGNTIKKWATPEKIAEWAYFMTMINTFCTGQNILIDGGESINFNFVWKN